VYSRIEYPRQLITPSDFQSTGYGIPAGIGAAAARPDNRVIIVTGDGSFAIHSMELREAVRQKYNLGVIVFNDAALGSIRMQQLNTFGQETTVTVPGLKYAALTQALNIRYFSLADNADTLEAFLQSNGVRLLELRLTDSPGLAGIRRRARLREQISRSPIAPALRSLRKWLLGR
jgi:thiamine pyrophosphate-dependent acetolactate synthase large subunit-like protein